ncbi:MAG TPA: hypothetical protein VF753_18795 [Terriglobales bacterium]
MKVLAAMLLSLSIHSQQALPKMPADSNHPTGQHTRKGGQWYFADSGHAVYCYGPVKLMQQPDGGLQRVATFCEGANLVVPLKD